MSRQIDITKPLSDDDRAYLSQWGRDDLIARADAIAAGKDEASSGTAGVALPHNATAEQLLEHTPNTGDVNTGVQKQTAGSQTVEEQRVEQVAKELEDKYKADELRAAAEKRDLDTSGTKPVVARRLAEHLIATGELDAADDDEDDDSK